MKIKLQLLDGNGVAIDEIERSLSLIGEKIIDECIITSPAMLNSFGGSITQKGLLVDLNLLIARWAGRILMGEIK